ncbi:hypothetical protein [Streptomyces longwoodensis]|uniref:hypothetical protein n=1 Tax=Streptomyces longwoodensis TaxID=68231 RepID=UPI0036FD0E90
MVVKIPRQEVAPALQAMMLGWMDRTAAWDESDTEGKPRMLTVYTDELKEVPLPPVAYGDSPNMMIKKLADIWEAALRKGEAPPKPKDMIAVGMLLEFWEIAFTSRQEREAWRRRNFAEHPRAVEARMLIVHQPGYRPAVAQHQRDRRGTGVELTYPLPMMSDEPLLPGGRAVPLLVHLERLARVMLAPPTTFWAKR